MPLDQAAIALAIAAPGLFGLRAMLAAGLNPLIAIGGALLCSTLWSAAVMLILAVARDSVFSGAAWALLATGVLLVEVFGRRGEDA